MMAFGNVPNRRLMEWVFRAFAVAIALTVAVPQAGFAGAETTALRIQGPDTVGKVRLTLNKSRTFKLSQSIGQALVANPDIADLVPLTDQSIYLVGKQIGLTRLTLVDANKKLLGIFEVEVSYDVAALSEELSRTVPGGEFRLRTANGRIVLDGSVADSVALSKAMNITQQFTGDCEGMTPRDGPPLGGGSKPSSGGPAAGSAPSSSPSTLALGAAMAATQDQDASRPSCIINSLVVRAPQQVLLEVRFVEAQRSAARDLGFAWDVHSGRIRFLAGADSVGSILGGASSAVSQGFPSGNAPFGTFLARILDTGTSVDVLIEALEKQGIARRLAEPNLVALSGDTANFLAGGEFPFPVAQSGTVGAAAITIEFKKFGVGLAFTPTVLANGQINLKIEPEVSDIDPSQTFKFGNGIEIPGLIVRRASTTIEMRDGQSFAIAGLLQTNHTKSDRQLPWLGSVPVLGALFSSNSYKKEESDLVIIVTLRLVKPAAPGQRLATPLDDKVAANDREFFLRRNLEVPKHETGAYGHILTLDHGPDRPEPESTYVPPK